MTVREPESLRTRTAAFLFWDTVGSTALLARLGDERAEEVRRRLFAVVREVVTANRGEEVKNTGDGLMVAFPSSLGDSLSCAIGIQRAVAVLDVQFPDVELAVRVGITAGDAVSDAVEGDWFGRAVTTAARLCDAAPANESFATAALAELTDWSVEPVGPLTLKGLPEPVDTVRVPWTLTDRTAIVALPPVLQLGEGLPLVGRRDQLARLDRSFERARQREPVRVRITGPIGCGVTRLAREWLHGRGLGAELVLGASCVDRDPFDAIAAAVDWHAASRSEDLMGPDMDGLAPLIAAVAPSVARRLGVAATHAPRAEVEAALLSYVRGLTDAGPVVVVFDDCAERHHIAMDEIADALAGRPALIVSAGPADIAEPGDIGVRPLTVDEIAELLNSALRLADGVDSATADLIAQESGGVALQVCEVVNALTRERADLSTVEAAHAAVTSAITLSCPYRGLKSMGTDDHALYFGRDGLLAELIGAVGRSRVTVVSGMSGSGKSSLLAAGLVPALQLGASTTLEARRPVLFTPGRDPDQSLDELIASHLDATALVGHSAQSGGGVVLIVDQLEEIWTHGLSDDERDRFVDRLVALGSQEDRDVRVVLGLRSDFLGRALQHDRLRSALRDSQVLVGTPDVDDLRRMILGPAETTGFALEDGLVERFLSDVAGETGALPLLSHALYETWRRRKGRMLTIAGYEACGAIQGAIAATADGVVGSMTADEVDETRHLFNRLVTLGQGQADTRRRARTEELTPASRRVAENFVEARLLIAGEDTIEVSHEALLQHWPRLVGWLSEDRDDLRRLRHLADAVAGWEAAGRAAADLYRGSRLETATEVAERRPAALNESERAFLDAGSAEAALVARREKRRRNLMRSAVVGLACLLIAAVVAGLLAVGQSRRAEDETRTAREQRVEAVRQAQRADEAAVAERVERLMAESRFRQGDEIDLSILLALEAMRRKPGQDTERVLFEAITSAGSLSSTRLLATELTRPAASTVSSGGEVWRATADGVVRIDMASGEITGGPITLRPGSRPVQVEPLDGGLLAVAYEEGLVQLIDQDTGAVRNERQVADKPVFILASGDGETLAVNAVDGRIRFLSVPELDTVSEPRADISPTWVAANGGVVVSGGPLGTRLQKYDARGLVWAEEFEATFSALAVDDSTATMAAALSDGRVMIWSGDDVSTARTLIEFEDSMGVLLAFGAETEDLVVARDDGTLLKVDLTGTSSRPVEELPSIDERLERDVGRPGSEHCEPHQRRPLVPIPTRRRRVAHHPVPRWRTGGHGRGGRGGDPRRWTTRLGRDEVG